MFIDSSYVSEFSKLSPPKCNSNLFYHFFNPYIFLNLESIFFIRSYCSSFCNCCCVFYIRFYLCPISINVSCGCDYLLSPTIVDMSSTSNSITCPTFDNVSCAHDYVLFLITYVYVSSFDYQLTLIFSTCDFMVFGSEPRKQTNPKSPIKDVLKIHFLDFNDKELKMLIKEVKELVFMSNFG